MHWGFQVVQYVIRVESGIDAKHDLVWKEVCRAQVVLLIWQVKFTIIGVPWVVQF